MKSLKTLSNLGAIVSIGLGVILFITGLQRKGIAWATISGIIVICSGITNLFAVRLGIIEALGQVLLRIAGLLGRTDKQ